MSQNNDKDSGAAAAVGFVFAILAMMALALFAVAAFLAFVLTILSIIAWNNPLRIGKWTFEPADARAFVFRGLCGAILVPAFIAFCEVLFQTAFRWDLWPYYVIGGYVLGSIGVEILMAQEETPQTSVYTPPPMEVLPPQRPEVQKPPSLPAPPFRYASWDDEDAQ